MRARTNNIGHSTHAPARSHIHARSEHAYKDAISAAVGVLLVNAVVAAYVAMAFNEKTEESGSKSETKKAR